MKAELLRVWLTGTTCCRDQYKEVVWESDTHVLLRHIGHSSYVDRMSGTQRCGTYVALLRKDVLSGRPCNWDGHARLKTWNGRWTKAKLAEAMVIAERDGATKQ